MLPLRSCLSFILKASDDGFPGNTNPSGGMSDIDSTKFRWLNPIAMLVITVNQ
jgi:hypothetical protein